MKDPLATMSPRRYWGAVILYVALLLTTQSVMGLGIDKFKELWGVGVLDAAAYTIVAVGAAGVAWTGLRLWGRCRAGERAWIAVALMIYGAGTLTARSPQERLHYLGYGILSALLYFGFARDRALSAPPATKPPPHTDPGGGHATPAVLPAVKTIFAGAAIGYGDELLQILWPRRYFDWADVAMNIVSVVLGLLVAVPVWNALRRPG